MTTQPPAASVRPPGGGGWSGSHTLGLCVASFVAGMASALVIRNPPADLRIVIPLLTAAAGFVAGQIADQFRIKLWERQERWKLRRELYTDLLHSLAALRSAQWALISPLASTLPTAQFEALIERNSEAQRMFLKAMAGIAIVDTDLFEACRRADEEWRSRAPIDEGILQGYADRHAEFQLRDSELASLDQSLERRMGPLSDKVRAAVSGAGVMSPDEQHAFSLLLLEGQSNLRRRQRLNAERGAASAIAKADVRRHAEEAMRIAKELQDRVIAAAKWGGLDP